VRRVVLAQQEERGSPRYTQARLVIIRYILQQQSVLHLRETADQKVYVTNRTERGACSQIAGGVEVKREILKSDML